MATIVVHPEKDQLKAVKAILKALKVPFEEQKGEKLPEHVIRGFKQSQKDVVEGRVYDFTTVEEMIGCNMPLKIIYSQAAKETSRDVYTFGIIVKSQ